MLPPQFADMHDVFHVSMLYDYVHDPTHVLDFSNLAIPDNIFIEEYPHTDSW